MPPNKSKGLPRSVLMVTLNNKDTGEPLAYMSANLLSAARTGAVPGVATRHLARKDAEVLLCIGCGAIGTSCLNNVITQMPNVKKVICNNHSVAPAEKLAAHVREQFGIEAVVEQDLETAVRQADVINVAASRTRISEHSGCVGQARLHHSGIRPVHFDQQEGGSYEQDGGLWTKMKVVYDHIGLHEAYVEDAIATGDKEAYYARCHRRPGVPPDRQRHERAPARIRLRSAKSSQASSRAVPAMTISSASSACGMSVFDLGLGYDLYETALEKGIGTKLLLWENPAQCE